MSQRLPWDCAIAWADRCRSRAIWLCDSALGVDELVSFSPGRLRSPATSTLLIQPGDYLPADGTPD
ncbi:MAG: hypothetical protein Q4F67_04590, partial [Propionibacteriaceae bacterium]|nr:hypothetical protein [Propionibacteriaceae bacterium]